MRIGVRAHDFGKLPIEILSESIWKNKFSCIQLALIKAIAGIDSIDGIMSPGLAYEIGREFHKRDIQIAILGCYINPIHPDHEERKRQINRFKEHIRYARDFGCSVVATETGSFNPDCSYNPQNRGEEAFRILTESVGELTAEAEKFGVFVGIEGVTEHVIHTPSRMKSLLDTIDSGNLQVVFDPVNFISPENYKSQRDLIKECFSLFGDRIVAVHAKDFVVEGGRKTCVPAGRGILDYELLLKFLKSRKPYINILLEETTELHELLESKEYLRDLWERTAG